MPLSDITDVDRLKRINEALIGRVERSMDQQGNAFTLFQTAISLESRVRQRTDELTQALRRIEHSNRELSFAKEQAEIANTSKTRFLAAASHDVLQPLNAARLSVSALQEIQQSAEGRRLVTQVERSLDTMEELLRTLLDISRLDAGVMQPQIAATSLGQIFESLGSDFRPLAASRRLKLVARPTDAHVLSDRTMLRRILQNILSNSVRYTRRGGVLMGARMRGDLVRIDIVDTGIGIAPEQYEQVFEEFHRGLPVGSDEAATGGLGLGLSIVRRMVQALGHRIEFTSEVGRGTIFHLYVPAARAPALPPPATAETGERTRAYGLFGAHVLLLENDPAVQEATMSLMERWNCSVRLAATTAEAVAELGDTGWLPDIVIADQHLDQGDLGLETIRAVRAYVGREVPAVLVTADASETTHAAARDLRVDVMQKPVKPAELRALMAHLLA